jgi:acyl-CoA thioesterase II
MIDEKHELLKLLDLKTLGVDRFAGTSPATGWKRVFGGQVVAQALVAALRTVDADRPVHSLHGYFLRPGDPSQQILYEVERFRDGKSFTTRGVLARQHGEIIFSMSASFHAVETGMEHQLPMPRVKPPEELPADEELLRGKGQNITLTMQNYLARDRPIELRPADPEAYANPKPGREARRDIWFKSKFPLPDEPAVHQAVFAYASDLTIIETALGPHGRSLFDPKLMMASLDHAIWYHRPFRADQWLLYAQDSPTAANGRGYNRGLVFTRDGILVASVTQEALMRLRRTSS